MNENLEFINNARVKVGEIEKDLYKYNKRAKSKLRLLKQDLDKKTSEEVNRRVKEK